MEKPTVGEILEPGTLMLRINAGTAADRQGSYELSISPGRSPIIRSERTGRYFALSWQDIVQLAREAGVDEEPSPQA